MKEFGRFRQADHGSFIVDRRGTILGFDHSMEQLTGWPAVEVVGRNKYFGGSAQQVGGQGRPLVTIPLYEGEIPAVADSCSLDLTLHCKDGRQLEVEAHARRLDGPGDRMIVSLRRVTALSLGRAPLGGPHTRDPLTGMLSSESFAIRLASAFQASTAAARPLAIVLADIDGLRGINDELGGEAGDEVLRKLAGIMRVAVPDETRLCRLTEDDFSILMPDSGRGEARQLAASLRSTVERHQFFPSITNSPAVTLSLGAASYPADAESAEQLMERAREALDEARSMGRNRVWCYLRRPRVPLQVPVYFDSVDASLVGYTRDLSPSGVFVQTAAPIDVGMRCALNFPLPGHDGRVHVIGRVVRITLPETSEMTSDVRVPGMGIEFERFGGTDDRQAIECFLHGNEKNSLRPETGELSVDD